jgi:hypothetical protein
MVPFVGEGFTGLALPIGWRGRRFGWLIGNRWLHEQFPRLEHRREAFMRALETVAQRDDPAAVEQICSLLAMTLAQQSEEVFAAFRAYRETICANAANRDLVRFFVVAIASLIEDDPPHPILAGAARCGWSMIPDRFADVVIDFTLLLQYWRDGDTIAFRDHAEPVPDDPVTEPTLRIDDASDGGPYRTPLASRGEEAVRRLRSSIRAHLMRLATPEVGSAPGRHEPRTESRVRPLGSALGTVLRRHDYYLRVMGMMNHGDQRTLRLYEAYADICDSANREHVEQAILRSVVAAPPVLRANTMLRAATRRFAADDDEACAALAKAAFEAIDPRSAPTQGFMAATLVMLATKERDPASAHAWANRALSLAAQEHPVARIGLAEVLIDLCDACGDTLGRTRAETVRRDLVEAHSIEHPRGVLRARRVDPEAACFVGFEEIVTDIAVTRFASAYAQLSVLIGGIVETMPPERALARLHELREQLAPAIEPAHELAILGESGAAATLAAWIYGALAELHADDGDDASWEEMRRRQLELEDDYGAVPEHAALERREPDASARDFIAQRLFCRPADSTIGRASVERALAEAEAAFSAGRMRQAKFWTARAEALRARERRR